MNNTLAECPVKCLQHEGELQEFLKIYKEVHPQNIMEIGSFYGGTLWFFIKNNPELKKVIVLDMPISAIDERFNEMMVGRAQWNDWIPQNVQFNNYAGNSHDNQLIYNIKNEHPDNDIDMLHIDADHSYEGVKADYYNFKDMVRTGGMIVFHDVVEIPEVAKFWNELVSEYPAECKTISHEGGAGIGIMQILPSFNNEKELINPTENVQLENSIDQSKSEAEFSKKYPMGKTTVIDLVKKPLTFTEYRQENAIWLSNKLIENARIVSLPGEIIAIFEAYYAYLTYLTVFGYSIEFITLDRMELFENKNTLVDRVMGILASENLK